MIKSSRKRWFCAFREHGKRAVTATLAAALLVSSCPFDAYARQAEADDSPATQTTAGSRTVHAVPRHAAAMQPANVGNTPATTDSIATATPAPAEAEREENPVADDRVAVTETDTIAFILPEAYTDSIMALADSVAAQNDEWVPREVEFVPDPTKATWLSALFPGLGQIYNRRYWKLPIIVGGYLGLAYATNWNNSMLRDYTKAYADLLDNDPNTRSYMDMFSPNVKEESLDRSWLQSVLRSRKNYFRRNRDLCIICMVGVYLLAMVDAYVDASLSHFDISPDLSMDVAPALMQDGRQRYPSVGLVWALNF